METTALSCADLWTGPNRRPPRTGSAMTGATDEVTVPGYRHLQRIGQGGFSVVYRAYQERFERTVALKVLSVQLTDERAREGFLRELRLTSRLTGHPNVVTVLDSGLTGLGQPHGPGVVLA
jgi:serine/threonine protein kinase